MNALDRRKAAFDAAEAVRIAQEQLQPQLRVAVAVTPNTGWPYRGTGAVLLTFVDPCPYCEYRHVHGQGTDRLDSNGTYGYRSGHCGDHTHELRADGRRARLNDWNRCENDHQNCLLVPATNVPAAPEGSPIPSKLARGSDAS
jgi:hypothetical protein